jgi:hypothetical protein
MRGYIGLVSGQRLGKHVPAVRVKHATGEMGCYLRGPRQGVKEKRTGATSDMSSAKETEKRSRYI